MDLLFIGLCLKSAKILKEHDCGNDVVAFHCQQSVEKSLKAYLIVNGEGIVSGHSLIYLCKLSQKYNIEFKKYIKDCGFLRHMKENNKSKMS